VDGAKGLRTRVYIEGTWRLGGKSAGGRHGVRDGLEGNDQMTLGGERVRCFAVGGEVFVAPEDIGRGSGDDAAYRTTRLGRECHRYSRPT